MYYAMLAYHVESVVDSWTAQEDAALMENLHKIHRRLMGADMMGPTARLGPTANAVTLRGPGEGVVVDGPFAETKEQLLGFYLLDCADIDEAIAVARDLRKINPTAVYEIREIKLFLSGKNLEGAQI